VPVMLEECSLNALSQGDLKLHMKSTVLFLQFCCHYFCHFYSGEYPIPMNLIWL